LPAYSVASDNLLTIDGAIRGIVQHGRYNNATDKKNNELEQETGGAAIIDLEVAIAPTPADTLFTNFRFAAGNALNNVGGLQLSPYGLLPTLQPKIDSSVFLYALSWIITSPPLH
jgi:hypothetical protein